jgi:CheY-like chemotaxis protein
MVNSIKRRYKGAPGMESNLRKKRILVLDDEAFLQLLFSKVIPSFGYQVTITKDGADTLEEFAKAKNSGQPFSALILDLTVPGGQGGEKIIGKLREVDKAVPVIATSGYPNDPVMASPERFGFSGILGKPFRREELGALLDRLIGDPEA